MWGFNMKLTDNNTRLNLMAEDVLNMGIREIKEIENKRVKSIGRGNR